MMIPVSIHICDAAYDKSMMSIHKSKCCLTLSAKDGALNWSIELVVTNLETFLSLMQAQGYTRTEVIHWLSVTLGPAEQTFWGYGSRPVPQAIERYCGVLIQQLEIKYDYHT